MAAGDKQGWFARGVGFSQLLEFGDVMLCYDVEGEVSRLFSQSAYRVLLVLERGVEYFEILIDFLNTDAEHFTRLYTSSVEEDNLYVFAFSHAIELLEYVWDGICICEIDAECVDFDGGSAPGDERRIFILETFCITG
jgi:hypothetical protein